MNKYGSLSQFQSYADVASLNDRIQSMFNQPYTFDDSGIENVPGNPPPTGETMSVMYDQEAFKHPLKPIAPAFGDDGNFTKEYSLQRRSQMAGALLVLKHLDVDRLDETHAWGTYRAMSRIFNAAGIEDTDGRLFFPDASSSGIANLKRLQQAFGGMTEMFLSEEARNVMKMTDDEKYEYFKEHEPVSQKVKDDVKGKRGGSVSATLLNIFAASMASDIGHYNDMVKFNEAAAKEVDRMDISKLPPEEQAKIKQTVIDEGMNRLMSEHRYLALQSAIDKLPDFAKYQIAIAYETGKFNEEALSNLPDSQQDQVIAAVAMLNGQKINGEYFWGLFSTDVRKGNSVRRALWNAKESIAGIIPGIYHMGENLGSVGMVYALGFLDEKFDRDAYFDQLEREERKRMALEGQLQEGDGIVESSLDIISQQADFLLAGATSRVGKFIRAKDLATLEKIGKLEKAQGKYLRVAARTRDITVCIRAEAKAEVLALKIKKLDKTVSRFQWQNKVGRATEFTGKAAFVQGFWDEHIQSCLDQGVPFEYAVLTGALAVPLNAKIEVAGGLESRFLGNGATTLANAAEARLVRGFGWKTMHSMWKESGFFNALADQAIRFGKLGLKVSAEEFGEEIAQGLVTQAAVDYAKAAEKYKLEHGSDLEELISKEAWTALFAFTDGKVDNLIDTVFTMAEASPGLFFTAMPMAKGKSAIHDKFKRNQAMNAYKASGAKSWGEFLAGLYYDENETALSGYENREAFVAANQKKFDRAAQFSTTNVAGMTPNADEGLAAQIVAYVQAQRDIFDLMKGDINNADVKDHTLRARVGRVLQQAKDIVEAPVKAKDDVTALMDVAGVNREIADIAISAARLQHETEMMGNERMRGNARSEFDYYSQGLGFEINEKTASARLPGYVKGTLKEVKQDDGGTYWTATVNSPDGKQHTVAVFQGARVVDNSMVKSQLGDDSAFGSSYDQRMKNEGKAKRWKDLSKKQRADAIKNSTWANNDGAGVLRVTNDKGESEEISYDAIIRLANGEGRVQAASAGEFVHEAGHSIWRFAENAGMFTDEEKLRLASALGIDTTKPDWQVALDESMQYDFEDYMRGVIVAPTPAAEKHLNAFSQRVREAAIKLLGGDEKFKRYQSFKLEDAFNLLAQGKVEDAYAKLKDVGITVGESAPAQDQGTVSPHELPVGTEVRASFSDEEWDEEYMKGQEKYALHIMDVLADPEKSEEEKLNYFVNLYNEARAEELMWSARNAAEGAKPMTSSKWLEENILERDGDGWKLRDFDFTEYPTDAWRSIKPTTRFSVNWIDRSEWNNILDQYERGEIKRDKRVVVSKNTPVILQRVGMPNLPITITGSILDKITGAVPTNDGRWHNIPVSELRNLQIELDNPIAVFDSATDSSAYVILTRMVDLQNRERAVVAVKTDITSGNIKINPIASSYGKKKSSFDSWIAKGNLRYVNKSARKASAAWLQLPGDSVLRANRVLTEKDFSNELPGILQYPVEKVNGQAAFSISNPSNNEVEDVFKSPSVWTTSPTTHSIITPLGYKINGGVFSPSNPDIRFSLVTDEAKLKELEEGETMKVYRAMQLIDGKLYPPMSAKVDGKWRQPIELGKWEQSEERPDLIKGGKFTLNKGNKSSIQAAYNPYFHTSTFPLNDQFSSAYKRPELVTVEVEIPVSELTSGYKAEGAKDAVGKVDWHSGSTTAALGGRDVYLSRYDKPIRIVPESEVAKIIAERARGKNVTFNANTVTPQLKSAMEAEGLVFNAPRFSLILGEKGARKLEENGMIIDNLSVAKEMLGDRWWKDLSTDEKVKIKLATGWERGADGLWRYEVPDLKYPFGSAANYVGFQDKIASLETDLRDDLEKLNKFWSKAVSDAEEKYGDVGWDYDKVYEFLPRMYNIIKARRADTLEALKKLERQLKKAKFPKTKLTLRDFAAGTAIEKAYPELMDTKITIKALRGYAGMVKNGEIIIDSGETPIEAFHTVTHEVQHLIQKAEGFARGGNERHDGKDGYHRLAGEVEARNAEKRIGKMPKGGVAKWLERLAESGGDPSTVSGWLLEQTEDVARDSQIVLHDFIFSARDYLKKVDAMKRGGSTRFSLAEPSGKQKSANTAYPDASEEIREMGANISRSNSTDVMRSVFSDLQEGKDAIIKSSIGDVVFGFGSAGEISESGRIRHGNGILHIVYARMIKDGETFEQAIETALKVGIAVKSGKVARKVANKTAFQKDGYEGIVAKNYDGKLVVTGYKIESDVAGGDKLVPQELRTTSIPRKEDVVAALPKIIAKISQESQSSADETRFSFADDAKALILKKRPDIFDDYSQLVGRSDEELLRNTRKTVVGDRKGRLTPEEKDAVKNHLSSVHLDKTVAELLKFHDTKSRKAALHWFIRGAIRLPEDAPKVTEALQYADRAKGKANTDALSYPSPMAMIEALHRFKPKAKPIDPDTVPTLSDKRDMGNGVTTYLVDESEESQLAMRKIINTHWGEDANPWCLLHGDGKGNLSDGSDGGYNARHYWEHYSALPKRVAFRNGKLLAFMATDVDVDPYLINDDFRDVVEIEHPEIVDEYDASDTGLVFTDWMSVNYYDEYRTIMRENFTPPEQWWDRQDESHEGIPVGNIPVPNDAFNRWADFEIRDGKLKQVGGFHKGDVDGFNYTKWYANGFKAEESVGKDVNDFVYTEWEEDGRLFLYKEQKDGRIEVGFDYTGEDVRNYFFRNNQELRANPTSAIAEGKRIFAKYDQRVPHGKGVDAVESDGTVRFSLATYDSDGRDTLSRWLEQSVANGSLTRKDADDILASTDAVRDVMKKWAKSKKYVSFGKWSEAKVELDENGKPYFGVIRTNGDYAYNIDFSTVCKKRRPLDAIFNALVSRGIVNAENIGTLLSRTNIPKMQEIIKRHGLEVACALCFVDAKRYKIAGYASDFAKLWNGLVDEKLNNPKKWAKRNLAGNSQDARYARKIEEDESARVMVDPSELLSGEKFDEFVRTNPAIAEMYRSFQGVSKPKESTLDVPYNNDILKMFKHALNPEVPSKISPEQTFAVGGVRLQSFSDFVARLTFDYVQMFADLAARKLPLHSYTKEPDFIKLFGKTGAKLNMSLVPNGTGVLWLTEEEMKREKRLAIHGEDNQPVVKDGKIACFDFADECFPPEEAFALRSKDGNVGTIMVGVSDEHIDLMLADPRIDMVIPYHKSSINPEVAKARGIDKFKDYTSVQNTINTETGKATKTHFDFYGDLGYLDKKGTNDPRKTAANYVAWCKQNNFTPKFAKWTKNENYYKLLADFRLYKDDGSYAPQTAVQAVVPDAEWQEAAKDALIHDNANAVALDRETEAIVQEISREVFKLSASTRKAAKAKTPRASFSVDASDTPNLLVTYIGTKMARSTYSDPTKAVPDSEIAKLVKRFMPKLTPEERDLLAAKIKTESAERAKMVREMIGSAGNDASFVKGMTKAETARYNSLRQASGRKGAAAQEQGQTAKDSLEERRAKLIADAVAAESGLDAKAIEIALGIDLVQTISNLYQQMEDRPRKSTDEGSEEGVETEEAPEVDEATEAKIRAVVENLRYKSYWKMKENDDAKRSRDLIDEAMRLAEEGDSAGARRLLEESAALGNARAKKFLKDFPKFLEEIAKAGAAFNAEERAEERANEDEGKKDEVDGPPVEAIIAEAILAEKAVNLANPEQLAIFLEYLARENWNRRHGLQEAIVPWNDPVALKFLKSTAANIYSRMARGMMYQARRESAMSIINRMRTAPDANALGDLMRYAGRVIHDGLIRDNQRKLVKDIDRMLMRDFGATGVFSQKKEEIKRKVSADLELRARAIRKAIWRSDAWVAKHIEELQSFIAGEKDTFEGAGRDVEQSKLYQQAMRELAAFNEFGALVHRTPGEIDDARVRLEELKNGDGNAAKIADREARTETAARLLALAFDAGKTLRKEKNWFSRALDAHLDFKNLLLDMTRYCKDEKTKKVAEDIINYLQSEIQQANDKAFEGKRKHLLSFMKAVEDIYGKPFGKVISDLLAHDERFDEFGTVNQLGHTIEMSRGQAIQLYVSMLQRQYSKGALDVDENGNYTNSSPRAKRYQARQHEKIRALLSDEDLALVAWLGNWYDKNRVSLSNVSEQVVGTPVQAENENYFPAVIKQPKQGTEKIDTSLWSPFPGSLTSRVAHNRDFNVEADIVSTWMNRMTEGEQWKYHAKLGIELRGIFGRELLQETIATNHGDKMVKRINAFITDILNGGAVDKVAADARTALDKIRGYTALFALGYNAGVMIKQTTSLPAFAFEIGYWNCAKYMATALTPEGITAMRIIFNSEQRKNRWDSGNSDLVAAALADKNPNVFKRFLQKGMFFNKIGDIIPTLIVGQGIYRDAVRQGLTEEDALNRVWEIVNRTQQTNQQDNLAEFQRRSQWARFLYQFLSTQRQYLAYQIVATRAVLAQPGSGKAWKRFAGVTLLNNLILPSLYYGGGMLWNAILGKEPDDDWMNSWVASMLMGPYAALFCFGFVGRTALDAFINDKHHADYNTMMPTEQMIKRNSIALGDTLRILVDSAFNDEEMDFDGILKNADEFLRGTNAAYRDIMKFRENRED